MLWPEGEAKACRTSRGQGRARHLARISLSWGSPGKTRGCFPPKNKLGMTGVLEKFDVVKIGVRDGPG